jgi:hypothetical protein
MEKRVFCQLNGNRKVIGILRGYDVRSIPHFIPRVRVAATHVANFLCDLGKFGPGEAAHNAHMRYWQRQG